MCIIFVVQKPDRTKIITNKNTTTMKKNISDRLTAAINDQINAELWSAYLYLSMSMDQEAKGNKGFANWFFIQFQEEQDHARIFMNMLNSRGAEVKLQPIAEVQTEWESPLAAWEKTLEHEQVVTGRINDLMAIAKEERDYASESFLQWFVDEQIEEEENARDIIDILEKIGDNKYGLYEYDKELGARVYSVPSPLATAE